jgi:trk system potassium uptake protein TrkH
MVNFRIIARAFSLLLIVEGLFMLISAGVSLLYRDQTASSFGYSALITIVTVVLIFAPLRHEERIFGNKEGYIIVTGTWIIFSIFGTLPFLFSRSVPSFGDAFFEQCRDLQLPEPPSLPISSRCPGGFFSGEV